MYLRITIELDYNNFVYQHGQLMLQGDPKIKKWGLAWGAQSMTNIDPAFIKVEALSIIVDDTEYMRENATDGDVFPMRQTVIVDMVEYPEVFEDYYEIRDTVYIDSYGHDTLVLRIRPNNMTESEFMDLVEDVLCGDDETRQSYAVKKRT